MKNYTEYYYSPKQVRLPLFLADYLDICDPVLAFDQIMEEIGIELYLKPEPLYRHGRPGYNRVNMLKTILFGFMDTGYASLRELEDRCRVNICHMYLMDHETPSCRAFGYFINKDSEKPDIFWMVPVSSQYGKYKALHDKMSAKYRRCTKIVLGKCDGKDAAYLIQNAFPVTADYLTMSTRFRGNP